MRYKNIAGRFFGLVTKHVCDRQTERQTDGRTDRQNYDSQDRTSIAAPRGKNAKVFLQKFPQSATDFVLLIVMRSDREHLFGRKENKVSGILRELLKQKLSALHASSAVRVCQLLCTAPLETFQMQILTNNLGHRPPMNTRLP